MTYSVILVPEIDGQITAILEAHGLSATAPTREQALAGLRYRAERVLAGRVERTTLDLPAPGPGGLVALAGTFADDPDLPDLVASAYDQQVRTLFSGTACQPSYNAGLQYISCILELFAVQ